MRAKIDIKKGDKYGLLTIIKEIEVEEKTKRKRRVVLCKCDCGKETIARLENLRNGNTKSCGCLQKESMVIFGAKRRGIPVGSYKAKKLGLFSLYGNSIYKIWNGIKQRCNNNKNPAYKNYGGRGIKCEWNSFEEFYNDMGEDYKEGLTIERINVNGNYCKENCKWIERNEQSKNRRTNHYITYKTETKTLSDWAKTIGIKRRTLSQRINGYGWDIEKAFNF